MDWMTPQEIYEAGYNIDLDYKPVWKVSDVRNNFEESYIHYYERGASVTDCKYKYNHIFGIFTL